MNLYCRWLFFILFSRFQPRLNPMAKCLTRFRVWPTDLDLLGHMNNGKYFSILDLARVNLMIRSGMAKSMKDHGFYPVLSAETIRFKKSLRCFMWFDVQTTFLGWDDKNFWLEQIFMRGTEIYARALIKARILHQSGKKISTQECLQAAHITGPSPALPDYLLQWQVTSEI